MIFSRSKLLRAIKKIIERRKIANKIINKDVFKVNNISPKIKGTRVKIRGNIDRNASISAAREVFFRIEIINPIPEDDIV